MSDLERIKPIFSEALDKQGPERQSYLNEACREDPDLKVEVEALLKAHEGAGDFLEAPVFDADVTLDESAISEGPGTVIGRYKLLEKIGEGGMQAEPIRRKVALKIIKLGMDTRQVIARFEAERQALAMMDHPNIAKVLDAGATETGRPYFVMELVTGVSITEYCDKNSLSTKDRLELFIQVCNAVQHAHQKGIIHRDIKPSNVMVTRHDGTPIPKVIDFGIAKATNQRLTEKTLFTRYAHIIGTPAYMSPEQADLGDWDVDTRSDIYSLGVLLYELLTGTTPFSEEELRKAGYLEMQRVIREQEPPKPSTMLSTLGETLTDIAKHHASTPDLLTKAIRGDLDWIVMKTLEKTRDRRYDTASALALDIQRHLDNQPILARAPSSIYRLRKFLYRHRFRAIAALVALAIILPLIVMLLTWNQRQHKLNMEVSLQHRFALYRANYSFNDRDIGTALADTEPLLNSKYVRLEARILHDRILEKAREEVRRYGARIESDPGEAFNYLRRAQCHYCLNEMDKVHADMAKYGAILNLSEGTEAYNPQLSAMSNKQSRSDFVFAVPVNFGPPVNTLYGEWGPSISPDGLTLYFCDGGPWPARPGGYGGGDIWITNRQTMDSPWTRPVNLGVMINTAFADSSPSISADGLFLYFCSNRPAGFGDMDLYVSKRSARDTPWEESTNLGSGVNSPFIDYFPYISADRLMLYYSSHRSGKGDIFVATRWSFDMPFASSENIGAPINTADMVEACPWISDDLRTLFFTRGHDIYVSQRTSNNDPWGEPVNLGMPVSTAVGGESGASFTADGTRFFFHGDHVGGFGKTDLWEVRLLCAPDGFLGESNAYSLEKQPEQDSGKEVESQEKQ
ncbi:MAG: protein kinase domain-containing protein [Planctomycetota bacterium]|jgi:serine/threonine protein kinase